MHRLIFALALTLACDHDAHEPDDADANEAATPVVAGAPTNKPDEAHGAKHLADVETMPNARAVFAETIKMIEDKYVDSAVDLDAIYTGATIGALARLYQVGDHPVNTLMSPRELDELTTGTVGAIVGIGVEITNTTGVVTIVHAIPGGPAEKAGLKPGDRILGIGEERLQGLSLAAVVDKIRGAAGTEVDLFVQRDTEEWHQALTRASVALQNVVTRTLDGDIGHLELRGFAENTPAELDAAIADLQAKGMRSLILDLRDCPGGVFDAAITVTGRFLGKGQTIAGIRERTGETRQFTTEVDGPHVDKKLQLAVLVGPHTASGAEILADALQTHQRAIVIGQPTLGKDSVEHVHKLSNGWGLKLSSARLLAANGQPRAGKGVQPTLPVPAAETTDDDADAALSVARAWLRERR